MRVVLAVVLGAFAVANVSASTLDKRLLCPYGTYPNAAKNNECTICDPGYYCIDDMRRVCPYGSGSPDTGDTKCPCRPGFFSATGTTNPIGCTACEPGTYNPLYSQTSQNSCLTCPENTYSLGRASSCTPCPNGRPSPPGSSYCNCLQGQRLEGGICKCNDANSKLDSNGVCVACGPNSILDADATTCKCKAGYQIVSGTCVACPAGQYSVAGNGYCNGCPAGTFSASGDPQCTQCPSGLTSAYASASCGCPAGQQLVDGVCTGCAAGSFAAVGSTTCSQCPSEASSGPSASSCKCPGGTYFTTANGPPRCVQCAAGMYAAAGSTSCRYCLARTYSAAGASACTSCPAGASSNYFSASYCNCPSGSIWQNNDCVKCKAGTYSYNNAECRPCDANTYSLDNAYQCSSCPASSTSPGGSATCSCNPGQYFDSGTCKSCASGSSSPGGLVSSCGTCAPNEISAPGSSTCSPCLAGTVPSPDKTGCVGCEANTFSNGGVCSPCESGTVSSANAASCSPALPAPSNDARRRDAQHALTCRRGEVACPVLSGIGGVECVNILTTVDSCGGCVGLEDDVSSTGRDCTAIPHVDSVKCWAGTCIVKRCRAGYVPDEKSQSCVMVEKKRK